MAQEHMLGTEDSHEQAARKGIMPAKVPMTWLSVSHCRDEVERGGDDI